MRRLPEHSSRLAGIGRHGTAMIVTIITILLVTAICVSLVRMALSASQQAERQLWRIQSVWLAESALIHAASRLQTESGFAGDTWTVDASDGVALGGRVTVRVEPHADAPQQLTVTATADVPPDETEHARVTRTLTIFLPETSPASTK